MKTLRGSLAAATVGLLLLFSALPVAAVTYATPDGYAPANEDRNHVEYWEDLTGLDCVKIDGYADDAYETEILLGASLVIVKAGSEKTGNNTLFEDVAPGETVFADTNENGVSDPGGKGGDKSISHVILCGEGTEEPTPTPDQPTPTPTPDQVDTGGGNQPLPTLAPTDTANQVVATGGNPLIWIGIVFIAIAVGGFVYQSRKGPHE